MEQDEKRIEALRGVLVRLRDDTFARVRAFREEQGDDVVPAPGDEMDAAKSLADVETHASLIDQAESRLLAIDDALARLKRGTYGICENCGEPIPLARLEAVPFATYCVDCQRDVSKGAVPGQGGMTRSARHRWTPTIVASDEDDLASGNGHKAGEEDEITVHDHSAFGPEEGELTVTGPAPRRRGRRKKAAG
ncbi:MAG: TraR/DksA family transcriptional regulator [Candidatus Binataceae bacterium]